VSTEVIFRQLILSSVYSTDVHLDTSEMFNHVKILWKIDHLLLWSRYSIFHDIY